MADSTVVTIPVGGMHCQNCVNAVQAAVSGIAGVEEVQVNLAKGLVTVRGNGVAVAVLRDAIEDLGFDAGEAQ